jgi:3-methyl-2-oxobutanoate hydroxymethyltransferase
MFLHVLKQTRRMSTAIENKVKRININTIKRKKNIEPISMITAYDYPSAIHANNAKIDIVLIGDSLNMVVAGKKDTLSTSIEQIIYHSKIVSDNSNYSFIVADMPFGYCDISENNALSNAIKIIKETGIDAIKIEGGEERKNEIQKIINCGIPVMGHIGLQPQLTNMIGGFKYQGKTFESAKKIINDAILLEKIGCFSIILECVPNQVAEIITKKCNIPIIGIGSGQNVDGQVLVYHDILGILPNNNPSFAKKYLDSNKLINTSLLKFKEDIKNKNFDNKINLDKEVKERLIIELVDK